MEMRHTLDTLAADPYFCQGPDAGSGLGGLHIRHKLSAQALHELTEIPRDELTMRLRAHLSRANPHMPPEEIRRRADVCRQSLEAATLRHVDEQLGQFAASALQKAAADIRLIASDPELSLKRLGEAAGLHTTSQAALLESMLGNEQLAEGLALRLRHDASRLLEQLRQGRRVALPQSTVSLRELQGAMSKTARQLDALAARLARPAARQGLDCMDLCPDLARGLLSKLPRDSCLAQALAERMQNHRRYQAWDRGLKMAGSLLLDIGACFAPALVLVGAAYNLGWATADGQRAEEEGRLRMLGALAAGAPEWRARQLQGQRQRARGQALFSGTSASLPANSYLSELFWGMDISQSAGEPQASRYGRPGDSPAR